MCAIQEVFGLQFDEWFKRGFCNDNFICYSYIYNRQIIANISINKFYIINNGELKKGIQLGNVMTKAEYRNRGLIRHLMNEVFLDFEKECDFIYLFSNDLVLDFYPKFGFKRVSEYKYTINTFDISKAKSKIRKLNLNLNEDKTILESIIYNRNPVSNKLGIINDLWPLRVYCYYKFRENLYYLEDKKIILILDRNDHILTIYDILSLNNYDLDEVIEMTVESNDKLIELKFVPEVKKYILKTEKKNEDNDTLFVKECCGSLNGDILFPITSHT